MQREQNTSSLQNFPQAEIWRLFIDGYRQHEGPLTFDVKEKGYLEGVLKAFDYMMAHLNEPVTPDLILNLHNIALKAVVDKTVNLQYLPKELNFRGREGTNFGVVLNTAEEESLRAKANMSVEGLRELVQYMKTDEGRFVHIQGDSGLLDPAMPIDELAMKISQGECSVFLGMDKIENMRNRISASCDKYYHAIQAADSNDSKLTAIIAFAKDLEVNHYFSDANCRTTVCLVMNKLLIENGFCPAIHENPNRVDGYSVKELLGEVKNGMEKFQRYALSNEAVIGLKGIDINKASDMNAVMKQIVKLISKDPVCAMAQVNHLYMNTDKYLNLKTNKNPLVARMLNKKNGSSELKAALATIYAGKLQKCLNKNPDVNGKKITNIIANHKIFQNNPGLVAQVSKALAKPAEVSPRVLSK